ncbi:MAG TPA: type II secretion system protein GspL [Candidatus Binatia bacterium]|jgi:Tfp pilus assembly protein PilN
MADLQQLKDLSRADFLTSIGLYLLDDRLVMVRLRKNFLTVSLVDQAERELPERDSRQAISELTGWVTEDVREIAFRTESDLRERGLREALVSLLPHINAAREHVYLCVPQDHAMVQQVFLPAAAQSNLQQVLEYEIERQLPFKREDIYYDFLPAGKKGDKLSVYVFAIPKKSLDGVLALCESLGIKLRGVETTATALANYLLFAGAANGHGAAVVAGHSGYCEMIGVEANPNGWQPTAELLFSYRIPAVEWAYGTGQELLLECSRQVPHLFRCGDLAPLNGAVDGRLAEAGDIASLGNPRLQGFIARGKPEEIPAIGAALRGVREASLRANFLRHENGEGNGGKNLSLLHTMLASLLLLAIVIWGVSYPLKDELRLRQLRVENEKLAPAIDALRRHEEQFEQLRKEASFFTSLNERRGEVLRVMDELSRTVPNSAYLSNLRYRAGVLEIQGNAENASAMIPLLERSPLFQNVGFNAPSNRGRDNRETFSLKADLEKVKQIPQASPKGAPAPAAKDRGAKQ